MEYFDSSLRRLEETHKEMDICCCDEVFFSFPAAPSLSFPGDFETECLVVLLSLLFLRYFPFLWILPFIFRSFASLLLLPSRLPSRCVPRPSSSWRASYIESKPISQPVP